jgi:hypothetical protein
MIVGNLNRSGTSPLACPSGSIHLRSLSRTLRLHGAVATRAFMDFKLVVRGHPVRCVWMGTPQLRRLCIAWPRKL